MAGATSTARKVSFGNELFAFLGDLAANNDRDWFAANRGRYESAVLEPALDFISDFGPRHERISPHFRADPRASGGSLFRIHRDTRFSKDKSPFKTNVGIHLRHERAKETPAPGFYLHLSRGESFAGGGLWHPDPPSLLRMREAIASDPDGWRAATRRAPFTKRFTLIGDSLKRPPAGFDADHPLIEDLKRKDIAGMARVQDDEVTSAGFLDSYDRLCRGVAPLVGFLCGALDLAY